MAKTVAPRGEFLHHGKLTSAERKRGGSGREGDDPAPGVLASPGLPPPTVKPQLLGHQLPLGLKESLQPAVCPHMLHVPSSDEKGWDVDGAWKASAGLGDPLALITLSFGDQAYIQMVFISDPFCH